MHSQPVESFVNRVVWERDKHWMKQRLIWKMSTGQIKTREDVQSCLNQAVNELRLSKANNIDPSCAYPNTMSNLNTDRYALSAPDVPGLYDTQPDQGISVLVEEALRRFGVAPSLSKQNPQDITCFSCQERGHYAKDCRSKRDPCEHCGKTSHDADNCWHKYPEKRPPRQTANPHKTDKKVPARVLEMAETNQTTTWKPEAPVFPWGQLM